MYVHCEDKAENTDKQNKYTFKEFNLLKKCRLFQNPPQQFCTLLFLQRANFLRTFSCPSTVPGTVLCT